MSQSVRLRPWQKAALDRYHAGGAGDFLAVATPGAGKTTFALTAARQYLAHHRSRVVVLAPTAHLKTQWSSAAVRFGLHLDHRWASSDGLPADMHGVVTTYQQAAASPAALRRLAQGAFVVLDEVHHAGDEKAWGDAVRHVCEPAARRLALSGTPFRSDTRAIPFVRYEEDRAVPDFEYSYGDALGDGRVVRPVFFPRTGGEMEWTAPDGSLHSATFADALDATLANQRLRTALSLEGQWLPEVLRAAHSRLTDIRRRQPDAGGLVIALDQDHAHGIARHLRERMGCRAAVAVSDDPSASAVISTFAGSSAPWLVAVRMVSEGVDIPRLRVGVYATTTTTELFFRQAVGRLVRWTSGQGRQRSYLFIPDDPRLRTHAARIAEQRRHSLEKRSREAPDEDDREAPGERDQLSLFAVISAVATGHELPEEDEPEDLDHNPAADDPTLLLDLGPLPPAGATPITGAHTSRREHKDRLRRRNAELARDLARRTGWPHARVNAELNRLAGVGSINEATAEQLERRLRHGESWLSRARPE